LIVTFVNLIITFTSLSFKILDYFAKYTLEGVGCQGGVRNYAKFENYNNLI